MKSNITDPQYSGGDLQLTEPHFDEEATVLSARPVVPLEFDQERPKAQSGRRLAFVLAMVIAVMAGVLVGMFIYTQRGQEPAANVDSSISLEPPAATFEGQFVAGAEGVTNEPDVSSEPKTVDIAPAQDVQRDVPTPETRKSAPPLSARSERGREPSRDDDEDNYEDDREARADKKEARRLRRIAEREAKREARGPRRSSAEDLLRIREIFEGSPRP